MAELNISNNRSRKKYFHKHIKVALTPMVDLGFLLITFFILTTTLQEQGVTKLLLPKDSIINTLLPASTTLTFILERSDSIGYYDGLSTEIRYENFASMRSIIRQKQIDMVENNINKHELTLIIKSTTESTYKNFIDALDEITISDCKHYFIAEPGKDELLMAK